MAENSTLWTWGNQQKYHTEVKENIETKLTEHVNDDTIHLTAGKAVEAAATAISNPNLLDNPDFEVNQKGFTEVNSGTDYTRFIDRWVTGRSAVKKEANGISFAWDGINQTSGYINQRLEKEIKAGTSLTCQVKINGTVYSATHIVPDEGNWVTRELTTGITSELGMMSGKVWHQIKSFSAEPVTIEMVKLEVGSVATPFAPPDPATELAKCQRYYQIRTTGDIDPVDLRPSMRITPTVTQLDDGNYEYNAEL